MDGATLLLDLALITGAYLCGSIPMGVVVARLTGGVDPRTVGSGRTGGTNALRALGRRRAAIVVTGDLLKGALPVLVCAGWRPWPARSGRSSSGSGADAGWGRGSGRCS